MVTFVLQAQIQLGFPMKYHTYLYFWIPKGGTDHQQLLNYWMKWKLIDEMKENSEIIINRLIHPLNNIDAHISELKMFFNLFSTNPKNIVVTWRSRSASSIKGLFSSSLRILEEMFKNLCCGAAFEISWTLPQHLETGPAAFHTVQCLIQVERPGWI